MYLQAEKDNFNFKVLPCKSAAGVSIDSSWKHTLIRTHESWSTIQRQINFSSFDLHIVLYN